jgi:lipoprotein-anchoring transpeptidase ErfK/SrfK
MQSTSLHVSVRDQQLTLKSGKQSVRTYPVSTSRFGIGSEEGSMKTPLGQFRIAEKFGADTPVGTVFKNREPVGFQDEHPPDDDLVLSRILWLEGLEGHNANTRDRFIYIHGTNHEYKIGEPASHGCIRMRNADLVELFELIEAGTPVTIEE